MQVSIAGGGVAGTVCAIALRRIKHFHEKATSWLYTYDVGPLPVSA
ncbi:hypothetical protein [Actinophytocola sp. NPDC049390]